MEEDMAEEIFIYVDDSDRNSVEVYPCPNGDHLVAPKTFADRMNAERYARRITAALTRDGYAVTWGTNYP